MKTSLLHDWFMAHIPVESYAPIAEQMQNLEPQDVVTELNDMGFDVTTLPSSFDIPVRHFLATPRLALVKKESPIDEDQFIIPSISTAIIGEIFSWNEMDTRREEVLAGMALLESVPFQKLMDLYADPLRNDDSPLVQRGIQNLMARIQNQLGDLSEMTPFEFITPQSRNWSHYLKIYRIYLSRSARARNLDPADVEAELLKISRYEILLKKHFGIKEKYFHSK